MVDQPIRKMGSLLPALVSLCVGCFGAFTGWLAGRGHPEVEMPRSAVSRSAEDASGVSAAPAEAKGTPLARTVLSVPSLQSKGERVALEWPIWEYELQAGIPARAEALTPPPWRMVGAVLVEGQWKLIIMRGGSSEPEFHPQGGKLPGGYLIEQITQEDVTLRVGGRRVVLSYIGSP